ncbi:MAG: hypothetical protein HN774_09075 [Bacteroidetes Order II. Incertae sedis bacterium]|jgi:hypothetical protein|nr:hypothetical protein [Bacteroidetes Order II. bacterium]
MSTPAIIWICLAGMTLVVKAMTHGQTTRVNVATYLFLDLPIVAGLMYWGGFFS